MVVPSWFLPDQLIVSDAIVTGFWFLCQYDVVLTFLYSDTLHYANRPNCWHFWHVVRSGHSAARRRQSRRRAASAFRWRRRRRRWDAEHRQSATGGDRQSYASAARGCGRRRRWSQRDGGRHRACEELALASQQAARGSVSAQEPPTSLGQPGTQGTWDGREQRDETNNETGTSTSWQSTSSAKSELHVV